MKRIGVNSATVIVFLLFVLCSVDVLAQDDGEEELVERTICVVDPVDLSEEEGMMESIGLLVSDTISVVLADKGYRIIDNSRIREEVESRGLSEQDLLDKQKIIDLATSLGADVVVNGVFRIEDTEVIIGVKAYDIFTARIATALVKSGPGGFGIYDTVDEVSEEVAGKIRENLKPLPESVITVEREKIKVEEKVVEEIVSIGEDVEVTFLSEDEGAEVYLAGEKLIATIEDGKGVYTAKANTVLNVVVRKERYHERKQRFNVGEDPVEFELEPLYRRTRWDMGFYLTVQKPLGASFQLRFHYIPDFLVQELSLGAAYIPHSYMFWEEGVDMGLGMFDGSVRLNLGWYPFIPPTFPFRFMIFLGGTLDMVGIPNSNVPFNLSLGGAGGLRLEWTWPRFSIYGTIAAQGNAWLIGAKSFGFRALSFEMNLGLTWKL